MVRWTGSQTLRDDRHRAIARRQRSVKSRLDMVSKEAPKAFRPIRRRTKALKIISTVHFIFPWICLTSLVVPTVSDNSRSKDCLANALPFSIMTADEAAGLVQHELMVRDERITSAGSVKGGAVHPCRPLPKKRSTAGQNRLNPIDHGARPGPAR